MGTACACACDCDFGGCIDTCETLMRECAGYTVFHGENPQGTEIVLIITRRTE